MRYVVKWNTGEYVNDQVDFFKTYSDAEKFQKNLRKNNRGRYNLCISGIISEVEYNKILKAEEDYNEMVKKELEEGKEAL